MSDYCLEKCDTANVLIARREPSTFQIKSRRIEQCIQRKTPQKFQQLKTPEQISKTPAQISELKGNFNKLKTP
jgi:hypothetical protein